MPLRGMDFSRSNQALSRFNQFLQYDLLDQFRSDRDVAILQVSDRLMRERQREGGEIEKGVAEFKSALTDKEAYTKAMLDYAKLPGADYEVAMARLATDPNLPPQYHDAAKSAAKSYAARILPLAKAAYNASRGITTWQDYTNLLEGGGYKGMEEGMKETGTNIRARMTAETARGEQAVQRERIGAEATGKTQAQQDKVTDRYIKWIDETTQFLVGEGVQGEAITGEMPIFLETKTRDPLSSEHRGYALTYLNQLKAKVMREGPDSLTDGNVAFITKVWNTPLVQGFVSERLKTAGTTRVAGPAKAGAATPGTPPISLETGNTAGETAEIQAQKKVNYINHYTELYIQSVFGGVRTPENIAQAKADATEFVEKYIIR